MQSKEYKMPDGRTAIFEYDICEVGKITLESMDMLMGELIAYKRCVQSRSYLDAKHCDGCRFYDDCPFNPREVEDEPQTMYYPQVDGITPSVIEPQFDKDINVRSKYKQGTWLYGDGAYCSCCGYKLETTALLAKCPKCGADMSKMDCAWK